MPATKKAPATHLDNLGELQNAITGMGTPGYDPTLATSISTTQRYLPQQVLESYSRNFKIIRKVVELIPNQMTRRWGTLKLGGDDGDPEIIAKVTKALAKLPVESLLIENKGAAMAFNQAMKNANRSGNGAIVMLADDGEEDPAMPLNRKNLRQIRGLYVLDRWSIQPDLTGLYQKKVEHYRLVQPHAKFRRAIGSQQRIHRSRVLWFRGDELSDYALQQNQGFDDSVLMGLLGSFKRFQTALQGAGRMVVDYDVFVHKVTGLLEGVMSDGSECADYGKKIRERLQMNSVSQSLFRSMAIDKDHEELEHHSRSAAGYADLCDRFVNDMLSNTDLEPSEFLGRYAQGMANTGKVEQENANERTQAYQHFKFDSNIYDLLELLMLSKEGPTDGKIPDEWSWTWHPVYPMSPFAKADLMMKGAQIDSLNTRSGLYTAEEAARSRYGGSEYNIEITIDFEERERQAKENPPPEAEGDPVAGPEQKPLEQNPSPKSESEAAILAELGFNQDAKPEKTKAKQGKGSGNASQAD